MLETNERTEKLFGVLREIVMPDFPGVFSSNYLRKVIFNRYDKKSKFCLIFGDFNGLNDINNGYGREEGDRRLKESIEIIQKNLPQNAITARMAGDEFVILLDDEDETVGKKCIKKINEELFRQACLNKAITMEMAAVDSSNIDGEVYKALEKAEEEVENNKIKRRALISQTNDGWTIVEELINENVDKFLKNLRVENCADQKVKLRHIRNHAKLAKTTLREMLSKKEKTKKDIKKEYKIEEYNKMSKGKARKIHSLFQGTDDFTEEEKMVLVNNLISFFSMDIATGTINKEYFNKLLLPRLQQNNYDRQYHLLNFRLTGLKMSNTLIGHEATDEKLVEIVQTIKQIVIDEIGEEVKFANKPLKDISDNENMIANLGGGKVLVLLNNSIPLDFETMERIRTRINEQFEGDALRVFSEYKENVPVSKIKPEMKKMKEILKANIGTYKTTGRWEDRSTQELLKIYLAECIETYEKHIKNFDDKKNIKKFMRVFGRCLCTEIRTPSYTKPEGVLQHSR